MPSDGDRRNKKQYFVQLGRTLGMVFLIHTAELVQMGYQFIKKIHAPCAGEHTGHCHQQTPLSAVLQRRQDQTDHRRGQHHTGSKGQHDITEPVGDILKYKTQNRTQDRGAAHPQSCQQYDLHSHSSSQIFFLISA